MSIEDYKLEIVALQRKDTENAKKNGFKNKDEYFKYIINEKKDEIAEAILDIARRYNVDKNIVAYNFDPTMIVRINKLQNN